MKIDIKANRRAGFLDILSGVLGLAGGIFQGSANKSAAKDQQRLQREAQELQLEMFEQARGRDGSSVLPLFFAQGLDKETIRSMPQSSRDALAAMYRLDTSNLSPEQLESALVENTSIPFEEYYGRILQQNTLMAPSAFETRQQLQPTMDAMAPAQQAGNQLVNDIFSGALTEQELTNLQPVADARINAVEVQKQAELEALQGQLNQIKAMRQAQGFGSDGLAQQMLGQRVRSQAAGNSAKASSLARLQNALDRMNVQNQGINRRLGSLNLPTEQVARQAEFMSAPEIASARVQTAVQSPLQFFRIGEASPPQVQPLMTDKGNSMAGQLLTGASGMVSAYENNKQQKQINDMYMEYLKQQTGNGGQG